MNKKATDKIVSVYWFAILFLVAGGVAYMVFNFYGEPFDVREIESNLLGNHLINCVSDGPFLSSFAPTLNSENVLDLCAINLETPEINSLGNDQYYFYIEGLQEKISRGNINLKEFCPNEHLRNKNTPICIEKKIYLLDRENNRYEINITSVVNKIDKNVK